jgi:outer membrane protein OmpA-like peptidoglycan-associated protein
MLAAAVAIAPACASKKFVRTEVGAVNSKVDTLSGTLEQTQERTRRNEERIAQVDTRAEAAGKAAQGAQTAADGAMARANAVGAEATKGISSVNSAVTTVDKRVAGVEAETRKLIFQATLSEDQSGFKFGSRDLPDEAKAKIDQVVNQMKSEAKNIFIEIEGHTDNAGSNVYNQALGLERAEAVKRYLYEQHQIPLHKMNVISYGEEKPVAPNNNREGRAQNRRVVIKVLS